jgi:hypothetical protein
MTLLFQPVVTPSGSMHTRKIRNLENFFFGKVKKVERVTAALSPCVRLASTFLMRQLYQTDWETFDTS